MIEILKILGFMSILSASTLAGFIYGATFKKRVTQLNELQRAIHQLENEIIYTHTSLPEAISNAAKKSKFPLSLLLGDISKFLYNNDVDDVYGAFTKALEVNKEQLSLKAEDINIVTDLAKDLGVTDISGHKKIFALTVDNLKKQIAAAEEGMNKNVKMYRYLGFSLGAVIIIMFI